MGGGGFATFFITLQFNFIYCIRPEDKDFLPVCKGVRHDVNLVEHMSDKKFLKWTFQSQRYFFQKNRLPNKMIPKKYFLWKKCTIS